MNSNIDPRVLEQLRAARDGKRPVEFPGRDLLVGQDLIDCRPVQVTAAQLQRVVPVPVRIDEPQRDMLPVVDVPLLPVEIPVPALVDLLADPTVQKRSPKIELSPLTLYPFTPRRLIHTRAVED